MVGKCYGLIWLPAAISAAWGSAPFLDLRVLSMTATDLAATGFDPSSDGPLGSAASDPSIWLKRDGRRPLKIRGSCMIEAGNWQTDRPFWHEIAIYELAEGDFAVSRKTFFKANDCLDRFEAARLPGAEDVVAWLSEHDAGNDLPPRHFWRVGETLPQSPEDLAAAEERLLAWRAEQTAWLDGIRHSYKALIERVLP